MPTRPNVHDNAVECSAIDAALRQGQRYALDRASPVNKIGAYHVALGTDIEGVGSNWSVNSYGDVRQVIKHLEGMKLGTAVIERVAYVNYAHVLKASMAT